MWCESLMGGGRIAPTLRIVLRRIAVAIPSLIGLPQVNLPLGQTPDGIPVGLSLIGWRSGDAALLRLAARLGAV